MKKIFIYILCVSATIVFLRAQPVETVIQQGHPAAVTAVTFSPDGKTIATGSKDKTIKLWEATTGNEIRTLAGHSSQVNDIRFTSDGKLMLSADWDHTVKVWDIYTGKIITDFKGHEHTVSSVACDAAGNAYSASAERQDEVDRHWHGQLSF